MGNCTTKLPTDNSYSYPLTSNPFAIAAVTTDNDTNNDGTLAIDTSANNNNNNTMTANNNSSKQEDIVILLATNRRRLLIYGYARYFCGINVPIDILEQLVLIWIDESFYWKIRYDQLYKLKNETDSVVSFTSSIFIYRNIKFQLQITKILKEHSDHGFQLSARLLSKNVIITTTIALQCDETNCGYHNFVENFFESGWPSSTLSVADINDDLTELNFICKFDILRIQPMMDDNIDDDEEHDLMARSNNMNIIEPYYKDIRMKQKVDILWSLNDKISPSYRTDNDDSSLILFYESPLFENGSYVVHFIQSSIIERDGFAVMLELFNYPQGVIKMTLKWIVIVSYDGKIIKKSATDQFALNDSCHSKAFSKSDFHFIGESNAFSLSLLTIKVEIEILEIYDEYNEIIKTNWKNNIRHWPKYGIFNEKQSNINDDNDDNDDFKQFDVSNIMKLENKIKKMDEKLNQLLSIQNGNEIPSKFNMKRTENGIKSNLENENENECMIKKWLLSDVGLPNYYDLLIENGFDSLDMIKEINNLNELNYIGVNLKAHQLKLMNHINKLKAN